jgi:NAD(P)-dependent dehydrogenase (short-subunit alcohol dehydrogenase family)
MMAQSKQIPQVNGGKLADKENPVVIVTGASRGLGAATAWIASQMGAKVVLVARSEQALTKLVNEIQSKGGYALAVVADVSVPDDCNRIIAEATDRFGRIDSLINNAGALEPIAPISRWDYIGWQNNLNVNLLGPVMMVQSALPFLREQSGRVINVSSGAAVNAIPGWGAYCTSKAALNQFTRVLSAEEEQITAIAFRPGVVDTEMQATIRRQGRQGMPLEDYAHFVSLHTEGKLLRPENPARALVVLSLYSPHEWSGEFLSWDNGAVQELVSQYFTVL